MIAPARRVKGRIEALPFQDREFDVVTCAWAIETVPKPETALSELCRVVRPGGAMCLVFCADTPARDPSDWLMRQALSIRGSGRFLSAQSVIQTIESQHGFTVRPLPCGGPVAALIVRRSGPAVSGGKDLAEGSV